MLEVTANLDAPLRLMVAMLCVPASSTDIKGQTRVKIFGETLCDGFRQGRQVENTFKEQCYDRESR